MKKILILSLHIWVWWLASCTPEPLAIDVPQAPIKTVVATQFYFDTITQQSAVMVVLSKSLPANQTQLPTIDSNGVITNSELLITGATVSIQIGPTLYECNEMDRGMYLAMNVSITDYASCRLMVKDAAGNFLVDGETIAQPAIAFQSVDVFKENGLKQIAYTLHDDTKHRNWYLVNYFTNSKSDTAVDYTDPQYIAKRLTEQKLDFDLYQDSDFKEGVLSVKKSLGILQSDTVALAVSEISEGYFQFLNAQKKYGLLINQLKGEVINFPTNIRSGLGYFTIHQPKLYLLQAPN